MTNSNHNNDVISAANPHTIKKFELIEKYVEAWAHKLLNNQCCSGIVFIDCMSNSGEYVDDNDKQVFGTPVRVARYLRQIAGQYSNKQIDLYFSDLSEEKTSHLKNLLPNDRDNFHCHVTTEDGNELAKRLGKAMSKDKHYLLVYDPYDATIDWSAIMPFINSWSEVILNHMVSDSIRAVKMVKKDAARSKYEHTYLTDLENLTPYGSDKTAYEKRIEEIIKVLRRNERRQYYIAAFPFFNEKNSIVYNLIHCTSNIEGFKLYKKSAWQTFGGKSSTKKSNVNQVQLVIDFDGNGTTTQTDEDCFTVKDIAKFLQNEFAGQNNVPLDTLWCTLNGHPIFPSDGFKQEIKKELCETYKADTKQQGVISFRR